MELFDKGFGLALLIFALYGMIRGPLSLLAGTVSLILLMPLIHWLRPFLLALIEEPKTLAVVSLIYYPIISFVVLGLATYLGRSLDAMIRRFSLLVSLGTGFFAGAFLCLLILLPLTVLVFPFIKLVWPQSLAKSYIFTSIDHHFTDHPDHLQKIQSWLKIQPVLDQLQGQKNNSLPAEILPVLPLSQTESAPDSAPPSASGTTVFPEGHELRKRLHPYLMDEGKIKAYEFDDKKIDQYKF